jgi:hypothetical protein
MISSLFIVIHNHKSDRESFKQPEKSIELNATASRVPDTGYAALHGGIFPLPLFILVILVILASGLKDNAVVS